MGFCHPKYDAHSQSLPLTLAHSHLTCSVSAFLPRKHRPWTGGYSDVFKLRRMKSIFEGIANDPNVMAVAEKVDSFSKYFSGFATIDLSNSNAGYARNRCSTAYPHQNLQNVLLLPRARSNTSNKLRAHTCPPPSASRSPCGHPSSCPWRHSQSQCPPRARQ